MSEIDEGKQFILSTLSRMFDEEVSTEDMFIDLGGISIMALSLRDELLKNGMSVSVNEILGEPVGSWGENL